MIYSSTSHACVIPTTDMIIVNDTTFCGGFFYATNITIASPGIHIYLNSTTDIEYNPAWQYDCANITISGDCLGSVFNFQPTSDGSVLDCNGGKIVGYGNWLDNGPYGLFTINVSSDYVNIKNCDISAGLSAINIVSGANNLNISDNTIGGVMFNSIYGGQSNNSIIQNNNLGNNLGTLWGENYIIRGNQYPSISLGNNYAYEVIPCLVKSDSFSGNIYNNNDASYSIGCISDLGLNITNNNIIDFQIVTIKGKTLVYNNSVIASVYYSSPESDDFKNATNFISYCYHKTGNNLTRNTECYYGCAVMTDEYYNTCAPMLDLGSYNVSQNNTLRIPFKMNYDGQGYDSITYMYANETLIAVIEHPYVLSYSTYNDSYFQAFVDWNTTGFSMGSYNIRLETESNILGMGFSDGTTLQPANYSFATNYPYNVVFIYIPPVIPIPPLSQTLQDLQCNPNSNLITGCSLMDQVGTGIGLMSFKASLGLPALLTGLAIVGGITMILSAFVLIIKNALNNSTFRK